MSRDGKNLRCTFGALVAPILIILEMGVTDSTPQPKSPPSVASASVPLYPRTPQMAHIEGVVRLRISTDGAQASAIKVESSQPMLAHAAKDNVKTWQFDRHSPTTFEATFRYRLLPSKCDSECNCDSLEKGSVQLKLPTDVEVTAKELLTCDPAIRRQH